MNLCWSCQGIMILWKQHIGEWYSFQIMFFLFSFLLILGRWRGGAHGLFCCEGLIPFQSC